MIRSTTFERRTFHASSCRSGKQQIEFVSPRKHPEKLQERDVVVYDEDF
ncbi:MAG: hypothetical protein PHN98_03605 [Smithellaceae bacterium]|nr:hypothetical protein [Smithellaceae bacterium]